MSTVAPGRLLDDLREVLAEPVVGHAAGDLDAGLLDVCELDGVVRLRPDRLREIHPHLALDDVEGGGELDVADVVAAEVDVHEPRHELLWIGVLVVLDALQQRVGAVPDADDGDADLLLRAPLRRWCCRSYCHPGSSLSPAERDSIDERRLQTNVQVLRERLNDDTVRVRSALEGLGLEPPFQLRRHPENDDRALPGSRSSPSRGLERQHRTGVASADTATSLSALSRRSTSWERLRFSSAGIRTSTLFVAWRGTVLAL